MLKIFSKESPELLLHIILKTDEVPEGRVNLSENDQGLQVSVLNLSRGTAVPPHIHCPRSKAVMQGLNITQECWMVIRGQLRVRLFDLDHSLLHEGDLSAHGMLITFRGGHGLECFEDGTVMIECKNGPYLGRDYLTI